MLLAFILIAPLLTTADSYSNTLYDAPIPDRCATLDKATDSTNGNDKFCKIWFIDHRVAKN
jgi:hypothetical protein